MNEWIGKERIVHTQTKCDTVNKIQTCADLLLLPLYCYTHCHHHPFPFIHLFTFSFPVLIGFMQRTLVIPEKPLTNIPPNCLQGKKYIQIYYNLKTKLNEKKKTESKRERVSACVRSILYVTLYIYFLFSPIMNHGTFFVHIFFNTMLIKKTAW